MSNIFDLTVENYKRADRLRERSMCSYTEQFDILDNYIRSTPYPNCCTARVLYGFPSSNGDSISNGHIEYRGNMVQQKGLEELTFEIGSAIRPFVKRCHVNTFTAITTVKQEVANNALSNWGFESQGEMHKSENCNEPNDTILWVLKLYDSNGMLKKSLQERLCLTGECRDSE